MSCPNVAQQQFLAQVFKEALEKHDSRTIALLGCSTGNGLEYINKKVTRSVTAIDINPEYLEILRQRYGGRVPGLEIMETDLETCNIENRAYSLIFAGLVFEYLEPRKLLPRIVNWLRSDGVLVSILQLPAKHLKRVSETRYTSLNQLNSIMIPRLQSLIDKLHETDREVLQRIAMIEAKLEVFRDRRLAGRRLTEALNSATPAHKRSKVIRYLKIPKLKVDEDELKAQSASN